MEAKGWIKREGENTYNYSITERGIIALEDHREATGFYTNMEGR